MYTECNKSIELVRYLESLDWKVKKFMYSMFFKKLSVDAKTDNFPAHLGDRWKQF